MWENKFFFIVRIINPFENKKKGIFSTEGKCTLSVKIEFDNEKKKTRLVTWAK